MHVYIYTYIHIYIYCGCPQAHPGTAVATIFTRAVAGGDVRLSEKHGAT